MAVPNVGRVMGDIIRELRKRKGLTQEKLSEDICVPATLSRIENGTQVPGRATFYRLMERLGETGFSYEEFIDGESLRGIQIENQLFSHLEYGIFDKGEALLLEYKEEVDLSGTRERQFFSFIMLMWEDHLRRNDMQWLSYLRHELEGLLKMTYVQYPGISWRNFAEFVADEKRGAIVERSLYRVEKLLINNIAYTYLKEHKYKEAMQQYLLLRRLLLREDRENAGFWKEKAVYHNNIAVCEMKMENLRRALDECEEALAFLYKGAGIVGLYQLLLNRLRITTMMKKEVYLYQESETLKMLFTLLPEGLRTYDPSELLKKAPYVIRFF